MLRGWEMCLPRGRGLWEILVLGWGSLLLTDKYSVGGGAVMLRVLLRCRREAPNLELGCRGVVTYPLLP